jgi:hypothetical protein
MASLDMFTDDVIAEIIAEHDRRKLVEPPPPRAHERIAIDLLRILHEAEEGPDRKMGHDEQWRDRADPRPAPRQLARPHLHYRPAQPERGRELFTRLNDQGH